MICSPKHIPTKPWRKVMNTASARLPWQGMLKANSMHKKTKVVWPINMENWLINCPIKISVIVTPENKWSILLKKTKKDHKINLFKPTSHQATIEESLFSFRDEDASSQRDGHKVHNPWKIIYYELVEWCRIFMHGRFHFYNQHLTR